MAEKKRGKRKLKGSCIQKCSILCAVDCDLAEHVHTPKQHMGTAESKKVLEARVKKGDKANAVIDDTFSKALYSKMDKVVKETTSRSYADVAAMGLGEFLNPGKDTLVEKQGETVEVVNPTRQLQKREEIKAPPRAVSPLAEWAEDPSNEPPLGQKDEEKEEEEDSEENPLPQVESEERTDSDPEPAIEADPSRGNIATPLDGSEPKNDPEDSSPSGDCQKKDACEVSSHQDGTQDPPSVGGDGLDEEVVVLYTNQKGRRGWLDAFYDAVEIIVKILPGSTVQVRNNCARLSGDFERYTLNVNKTYGYSWFRANGGQRIVVNNEPFKYCLEATIDVPLFNYLAQKSELGSRSVLKEDGNVNPAFRSAVIYQANNCDEGKRLLLRDFAKFNHTCMFVFQRHVFAAVQNKALSMPGITFADF